MYQSSIIIGSFKLVAAEICKAQSNHQSFSHR